MTIQIKVPGASFTNFVATLGLPYEADAKFYGLFGTDSTESLQNRAGGAAATVIGTPTYASGYAVLGPVNAILAADVSQPLTFIMVVRAPTGANPHMGMIDFGGLTDGLLQKSDTNFDLRANGNASQGGVAGEIVGPTNFSMMAFSYDGANIVQRLYNGDPAPHDFSSAYTQNVGSVAFRLGGSGLTGGNDFHCAAAVSYSAAKSLAEIEVIHDYLQAILATRGITLL